VHQVREETKADRFAGEAVAQDRDRLRRLVEHHHRLTLKARAHGRRRLAQRAGDQVARVSRRSAEPRRDFLGRHASEGALDRRQLVEGQLDLPDTRHRSGHSVQERAHAPQLARLGAAALIRRPLRTIH
jgi:hypothetical protein